MVEVEILNFCQLYVKVGTIVEEATKISNRSAKSIEEERRKAEEKVTWVSS